jgi:hypothetical protein
MKRACFVKIFYLSRMVRLPSDTELYPEDTLKRSFWLTQKLLLNNIFSVKMKSQMDSKNKFVNY